MTGLFQTAVSNFFVGSFNLNGSQLSPLDALQWLRTKRSIPSHNGYGCKANKGHEESVVKGHAQSAYDSDLVILSLQECPTHPHLLPSSNNDNNDSSIDGSHIIKNQNELLLLPVIQIHTSGIHAADIMTNEDSIQMNIQSALSKDHYLVADIAMGEPPSAATQIPRWYGFIRLLVFAKEKLYNHLQSISKQNGPANRPAVIPIFAPAGRKADHFSSYSCSYARNKSPDKGGVCVYIPSLELLICSLHLCGTNSYNIPEVEFDAFRINELKILEEKVQEVMRHEDVLLSSSYHVVLCGDLNFRVEMLSHARDKAKGGNDYQRVYGVLQQGDPVAIRTMFQEHDRLLCYMKYLQRDVTVIRTEKYEYEGSFFGPPLHLQKNGNNLLLNNMTDVFVEYMNQCRHGSMEEYGNDGSDEIIIYPTFPLPVVSLHSDDNGTTPSWPQSSSQQPPTYTDKRTPSWTDRILLSKDLLLANNAQSTSSSCYKVQVCGADFRITCSDHAPIYALLERSTTGTNDSESCR